MTRKLNVLVVDDSPTIVRIVSETLQTQMGEELDITALTDPRGVLPLLDEYCCDILLTDVEMPGMTGLEVVKLAKRHNVWTQAIVMTAHSTCDRLAMAMDCGANDYLLKPVKADALMEVVSECARRVSRWQRALLGTLRAARA